MITYLSSEIAVSLNNSPVSLLDAFTKFIRPSIRMKQLAPISWVFMKFDMCVFFEKLLRKFRFHYCKIGQEYRVFYMKTS
jgi:hypothetical protein